MIRKDFNDLIFRTEKEKYDAITKKILRMFKKGSTSVGWNNKYRKIRKNFRIFK